MPFIFSHEGDEKPFYQYEDGEEKMKLKMKLIALISLAMMLSAQTSFAWGVISSPDKTIELVKGTQTDYELHVQNMASESLTVDIYLAEYEMAFESQTNPMFEPSTVAKFTINNWRMNRFIVPANTISYDIPIIIYANTNENRASVPLHVYYVESPSGDTEGAGAVVNQRYYNLFTIIPTTPTTSSTSTTVPVTTQTSTATTQPTTSSTTPTTIFNDEVLSPSQDEELNQEKKEQSLVAPVGNTETLATAGEFPLVPALLGAGTLVMCSGIGYVFYKSRKVNKNATYGFK